MNIFASNIKFLISKLIIPSYYDIQKGWSPVGHYDKQESQYASPSAIPATSYIQNIKFTN